LQRHCAKQSSVGFCVAGSGVHCVCIPEHAASFTQEQSTHPVGILAHAKLGLPPPGPEYVRTQNSPFWHVSEPHWAVAQYDCGIGNASISCHFPPSH
jgi:hypothetical protein